jgi:antitoxin component YwqK of YwqJK toxin-antitoxin module
MQKLAILAVHFFPTAEFSTSAKKQRKGAEMKLVILLVLSVTALLACEGQPSSDPIVETRDDLVYEKGASEPYTGKLIRFDSSGRQTAEIEFVNGVEERGTYTTWRENGNKAREEDRVRGELEGYITNYYESGQKESQWYEVDGEAVDKIYWYETGQKKQESIDGAVTRWHANGQKSLECDTNVVRLEGRWACSGDIFTTWYENGQKSEESNGEVTTSWYESGAIKEENNPPVRIGWHENGQKSSERNWAVGTNIYWNEGGQKRYDQKFIDEDENVLLVTNWHENGQKSYEGAYRFSKTHPYLSEGYQYQLFVEHRTYGVGRYRQYGSKEGIHTFWHDNGQKSDEMEFVRDMRHGVGKTWDENGKLIAEYEFSKDVKKSEITY